VRWWPRRYRQLLAGEGCGSAPRWRWRSPALTVLPLATSATLPRDAPSRSRASWSMPPRYRGEPPSSPSRQGTPATGAQHGGALPRDGWHLCRPTQRYRRVRAGPCAFGDLVRGAHVVLVSDSEWYAVHPRIVVKQWAGGRSPRLPHRDGSCRHQARGAPTTAKVHRDRGSWLSTPTGPGSLGSCAALRVASSDSAS